MTVKLRTALAAAALGAAALVALLAGPAQAQRDDPGLRANCAGDYFRYCTGMNPGGSEIRRCFRRNLASLSEGCRGAIVDYDRRSPNRALDPAND